MVEISVPELYQRNKRKLGEALVFENRQEPNHPLIRLIRLPGVISLAEFDAPADRAKFKHLTMQSTYHYPIVENISGSFDKLYNSKY